MKDRRIWVIIGCILVVGIAITSYTSSVVKKVPQEQKIQVLSETTAETAVGIVTLRLCRQSPGSTGKNESR